MSEYDVIIDDVTKTCFNSFKSHSESYVIGKALRSKIPPGICITILSFYEVDPCFFSTGFFFRRANNLVKWKA